MADDTRSNPFPPTFLWGVSGCGHQTEGNNTNSDTWFLEQQTPSVFREPSGLACDSYARWADDLDLAAGLGLNAYRFSVEWARVEPSPGVVDEAELDHYEAIVDGALARGMTPVVTYNHFTNPHWFAARGGFIAADAAERFADYCARVTSRFGDRIGYAVTLNEPNLPRVLDWINLPPFVRELERSTLAAAGATAGAAHYVVSNVVLPEDYDALEDGLATAHLAARAAITAVRGDLPVGLSLAIMDDVVAPGASPAARDAKRALCYDRWLDLAAGDDFVGVQNYEQIVFGSDGPLPPADGATLNQMHTAVEPSSLAGSVRYAYERGGVPVLVTEHGIAIEDDTVRAGFIPPALAGLASVIADGVPVLGYLHWTLLDNFEWVFGYASKLGLVAVDRQTMARTPKPSAAVYAAQVAAYRG